MKRQIFVAVVFAFCIMSVQFGLVRVSGAQSANNANNDLGAVNHGDFIAMQWDDADGAAHYYVYTSTSLAGPWTLLFGVSNNLGGAKVHRTPDARLIDLCYKVEATDANKAVIKLYEPICVPKYIG